MASTAGSSPAQTLACPRREGRTRHRFYLFIFFFFSPSAIAAAGRISHISWARQGAASALSKHGAGGGCICRLPSANSRSRSVPQRVTAHPTALGSRGQPVATSFSHLGWSTGTSDGCKHSCRPAQWTPKQGSKRLCDRDGETEAGDCQWESLEKLCPAGLCGIEPAFGLGLCTRSAFPSSNSDCGARESGAGSGACRCRLRRRRQWLALPAWCTR